MALADPQSISIGANTRTLARTSTSGPKSVYTDLDNGVEFVVTNVETNAGRTRYTIRVNHEKTAADPFTAVNKLVSTSAYMVVDAPISGYSRTELKDIVLGLTGWASAASAANLLKVLGRES